MHSTLFEAQSSKIVLYLLKEKSITKNYSNMCWVHFYSFKINVMLRKCNLPVDET